MSFSRTALELLEAAVSPAEIVQSFPSLSEQDVIAAEQLAEHCALTKWRAKKELQTFFPLTREKPKNMIDTSRLLCIIASVFIPHPSKVIVG